MISIKNLSKKYGQKTVVNNVNVEIQKGKITSFIGPNGAGKSTLLAAVSRMIKQDLGEVFVDGRELKKWNNTELSKKVAILKQSNHLNVRLTVRELVSFGRFPYSQGRLSEIDWQHVDEAISFMELQELENQFLDELSGGQRQRAFIAMVIAQDTDYILLDEPLNNLDMKHSVQIMKVLRRLVDELGKTVVIVIHDINFASFYSDYIVALKNGAVINQGPTDKMIDRVNLKEIYDMDIPIKQIDRCKVCVYFG
ncbi:iron ABC transporter ATP-binding protein [Tenuibacillus multivorans]|uniref:Iron complex transport system ATP-binding protein n=1 Tax=Tenuibacillus multivorans TaxID=237069 RepID=A0A1H0AY91_9BACI|nr:ABC transporter ATP-binding protein [Tenuibacillus multivorans]GEL77613.1 putative ABC transporter ATP-binding protein YclP [Tenuibacillus multivorans]SDN38450.1 iron complex transport system ATP-binding protein [Tenuibacillus multivorans]